MDPARAQHIPDRLEHILTSQTLPAGVQSKLKRLIERLNAPVRVVLFGRADQTRARIVNELVGREVMPGAARLPTLELRYGAPGGLQVMQRDGSIREDAPDLQSVDAEESIFVTMECDSPILKRVSILDIVTNGSEQELKAAVAWAQNRMDIALWCSPDFSGAELKIWRAVPQRFRDHSFLVLTGGHQPKQTEYLRDALCDDFLDVLSLTPMAQNANGAPSKPGAAGVAALAKRVLRHADDGRQADRDNALVFLKTWEKGGTESAQPARRAPARTRPVTRPIVPEPSPTDLSAANNSPTLSAICSRASLYLRDRGRALLDEVRSAGEDGMGIVASHCAETLDSLSDMLSAHNAEPSAEWDELIETVEEAQELIILLDLEGDGAPDEDAICLLLQLRNAFEAHIAT